MKKVLNEPLISIIIPVFNVEPYLERCIKSVLGQSYQKMQIILVDDGSTDGSGKICDVFAKKDKRIKVIHKTNGGISDARNVGLKNSNGQLIMFVDSDDWIKREYVYTLYETLVNNDADIAITDCSIRYEGGIIFENSTGIEELVSKEEFYSRMLWGERDLDNGPWAKLYKRELFNNIEYPVGRLYEDTATTYKIIEKCKKISIISRPLYCYMKRQESITQCPFNKRKLELIDAVKELTSYINTKYPQLSDACDRKMMWAYLSTLSQLSAVSTRYPEIEKKLLSFVKKNSKKVLGFKKTSRRDKIGIRCALLGFRFYRFSWRLYLKAKGKY